MQKINHYLLLLIFSTHLCSAQSVLFDDKNNYIKDLKILLGNTKNQNVIALGNDFETIVWSNTLIDDINKQKITEISKRLIEKKYTASSQFSLLIGSLIACVNNTEISHDILAHYLETLALTIEYQEASTLNSFLSISRLFFIKKTLFESYNNSCRITNGKYDFIYQGVIPVNTIDNQNSNSDAIPVEINQITFTETPQPTIEGPTIQFENIDLLLGSKYDSARVQKTNGSFLFSNLLFVGKGGKFDWAIVGKDVAEVFVDLKAYNFNVSNNIIAAENVEFNYPSKLQTKVIGLFEFKSLRRTVYDKASFPKFTSITNDVELKNLGKHIDYKGGFALAGKEFSSKCLDDKPASLYYNDGRNKFQTVSKNYNFKDSTITSDPTEVIIFVDNDTLRHPGVSFYIQTQNQFVKFQRDRGPFKNSMWQDTYHKMEFSIDIITWDLKSDSMNMDIYAAKSQIPAMFKSLNYFTNKEFTKIQAINSFHPLRVLFNYKKETKSDIMQVDEIVNKYKFLTSVVFKAALLDLKRHGFIAYDEVSGLVQLSTKANLYMQSFLGKSDFDGIYLPSLSPEEVNATLDTKDFVLKIRGVERFFISDSSNVFAVPSDKIVKIFYNREFLFNGRLVAGIFDIKGNNFRFNYKDFLVSMDQIDTIKFIVKDNDSKDKKEKAHYLDNNLVYASGTMYINLPENKSGKISHPEYPKFDATTGAFVYFNKKEILGGAYNRQVFFKIPPFKTDSVKGSDKSAVKFAGKFTSGGIFPEFDETLRIMGDNSLGFKHKAPQDGYELYGGKGKFFGSISLDHQGIRGNGEIKYLSSTFYSHDFVFYRDSVIAVGQQGKIKEQTINNVYYPEVKISDYEMKWVVKDDSLHLININHPFEIYKNQISLEGSLNLTPRGLFGSGMMEIKKVNVIASHYEFEKDIVIARHAVFNSKLPENPKPSLSVNNMHISFNLKESYADLSPEVKGLASMEFPMNQFKTSIENAKWEMNTKIVTMTADENDLNKSFFYSTNPEDDSLVFVGAKATYYMAKNLLYVTGVPYIKVFDTKIIPDSNAVTVYEAAELKPFKNAKLTIDTLNGYHHLDKGKIEIISRNKFIGSARYLFVNAGNDTMNINFEKFFKDFKLIRKDSVKYTSSEAVIKDDEVFFIAPKILYKGKAKLIAPNKLLAFDGKVKIDLKLKGLKTEWFPYQSDGSSDDVVIMLDKPKQKNAKSATAKNIPTSDSLNTEEIENEEDINSKLHSGLFYETGTNELYSTIVSTKRNDTDEELFSANGQLIFDNQQSIFKIGSSQKLRNESINGNLYTYNDTSSALTCEGKFKLMNSDLNFSITTIGEAKGSILKNNFAANMLLSLKLVMPAKALLIMAKKIKELTENGITSASDSATVIDENLTKSKIANLENDKAALSYDKNFIQDALYKPLFKYSSNLSEGICIDKINLNWSATHKSWHNRSQMKLSNILETNLNYSIKGHVEIKKSEQGDVFTMFLHPRSDIWYYIKYEPGRLSLLSSETDFMKAITEKSKGETGTPTVYTFVQSDFTEKQQFLNDFYKFYLGKVYNEAEEEKEFETKDDSQLESLPEPILNEIEPQKKDTIDFPKPKPEKLKKAKKKKSKSTDITLDEPLIESDQNNEQSTPKPLPNDTNIQHSKPILPNNGIKSDETKPIENVNDELENNSDLEKNIKSDKKNLKKKAKNKSIDDAVEEPK